MRNTIRLTGIALLSVLILSACKSTQTIFSGKLKPMTVEALDEKIKEQKILFETFSGKAKIDLNSPLASQSFSASIDIRKDSLIGMSLRMLGVEGARVRITPDSIEILDRLNQQYIPRDYQFLRDSLQLNLTFTELQNLIIGNPLVYDSATLSLGESDENYILIAQKDVYKNTISISSGFDILRMFIQDLYANRNLTLTFDGYERINGRRFALNRNLVLDAREKLTADIVFSNVEFDQPFDFSFSINPKYQRVD